MTGEGQSHRERKRQRAACPECNADLAGTSLTAHMQAQHDKAPRTTRTVAPSGDGPAEHRVPFPRSIPRSYFLSKGWDGKSYTNNTLATTLYTLYGSSIISDVNYITWTGCAYMTCSLEHCLSCRWFLRVDRLRDVAS